MSLSAEQVVWAELLGETFSGAGVPDNGLIWSDLEGWSGLPDARGEPDSLPGDHGRFRRPRKILREARVLTLTGYIYAETDEQFHETRDRLEEALGEGAGTMRISVLGDGVWERHVEIDTLKIDPERGRRQTKFVVDMVAPDPRRYGPLQTLGPVSLPTSVGGLRLPQAMPWNMGETAAGGRLLLKNSGRLPLSPVVRVAGGFSSLVVRNITTAEEIRLVWPVAEGEQVVIDMARRRVEVGSADVTQWLDARQWFTIPKGETHELRFSADGVEGKPLMWADFKIGAW